MITYKDSFPQGITEQTMKTVENVKVTEHVEVTQKQCIDLRSCFCNTNTDNANMGRAESIELVDSVNYYST
jgi:hypothetical protein